MGKAAQANGGGDVDQVASIKHKNNKQSSRKQKEETPPAPVVEEDTKEEKAKLVPTSEQLRLAQITQSQDNTMDPAPTVAGPTNTTQFQKQAYGSSAPSYGNSYGDSLSLGQSNTGYKNSYGQSESQGKSNTS